MARLEASERLALTSVGIAAAMVLAFDFLVTNVGLWPSVVAGCLLAAAFYRAGLQMQANRTIIDRKRP